MTRKEIEEKFSEYNFPVHIMEELSAFLNARKEYIQSKNRTVLYIPYDHLYTSLKERWVSGQITENTFWYLVDVLNDMEDV